MSPKYFAKSVCRNTVILSLLIATAGCFPSSETDEPDQAVDNSSGNDGGTPAHNSAPTISGSTISQGVVDSHYVF